MSVHLKALAPGLLYAGAKFAGVPLEPLGVREVRGLILAVAMAVVQFKAAAVEFFDAVLPLVPSELALAGLGSAHDFSPKV